MGKPSRDKGARGERQARDELREHGIDAMRAAQQAGELKSADVVASAYPQLHIEVKRRAAIGAIRFMEQAERDAGPDQIPVVMLREDRGPWYFLIRSADACRWIADSEPERREHAFECAIYWGAGDACDCKD